MYDEEITINVSHNAVRESSASRNVKYSRRLKHATIRAFDNGTRSTINQACELLCLYYSTLLSVSRNNDKTMCECLHRSARVCLWFVFKLLPECFRLVSQRGLAACLWSEVSKTKYGAFVMPLLSQLYFHSTWGSSVLIFRWLHVRNSCVWVENTYYFDRNLQSTRHSV